MLPLQDYPTGPTLIAHSNTVVATTAVTTEEVLATITLPKLRKNDAIRVTAQYLHTDGADDKTVRVKLGSTVLGSKLTTTGAGSKLVVDIANRGATNSQIGEDGLVGAVETNAGATLTITGQKETGANALSLARYMVELIQPPTR